MKKTAHLEKVNTLSSPGYTLIELLIALTIVGVLFALGYANFRDFTRRQALLDTSKKVQSDLRVAQQMALSGNVPNDTACTINNNLNGYFFNVISANRYEIRASCSGGAVGSVVKDVTLPANITISTPFPVPNPILFKVLGNGTNIGSTNAQIRVSQSGNPTVSIITISSAGQIQ